MVVNGFELPASFVKLCQEIRDGKTEDTWLLKGRVDAYGNRLSNSDVEFLTDVEKIKEQTDSLSEDFDRECFRPWPEDASEPGFVEVTRVDKLVWFGNTASQEPFCFDFGQDPQEPSIITWNDAYWQRRTSRRSSACLHQGRGSSGRFGLTARISCHRYSPELATQLL